MNKTNSSYGSSDQDKFMYSASSNPSGSGSTSSIRPHPGLLSAGGPSHPSGIPIQQQNHGSKGGGSIITGNPLRPPSSSASYHNAIPVSQHVTFSLPFSIFIE